MTLSNNAVLSPNPATDFERRVENDVVTLEKFLPSDATSVVVPAEIDGRPVAKIGVRAFKNQTSLTQIVLPPSVREIADSAFSGCASLSDVVFQPRSELEIVGNRVFAGCSALTSIVLPDGVKQIGEAAFARCAALTQVVLPSSVKSIELGAFSQCAALTQIDLPAALEELGETAFFDCKALTAVRVAPENANFQDLDGVLLSKDGKTLVRCP